MKTPILKNTNANSAKIINKIIDKIKSRGRKKPMPDKEEIKLFSTPANVELKVSIGKKLIEVGKIGRRNL